MIEVTVDRRRWLRGGKGPDGALSYSRLLSDTGSQRVHGAAGPPLANARLRHILIGYARVSKADGSQSLDLQRDALRADGVAAGHVYHDFASDVRDDRPGLDSCVRALRTDGAPAREDWDL